MKECVGRRIRFANIVNQILTFIVKGILQDSGYLYSIYKFTFYRMPQVIFLNNIRILCQYLPNKRIRIGLRIKYNGYQQYYWDNSDLIHHHWYYLREIIIQFPIQIVPQNLVEVQLLCEESQFCYKVGYGTLDLSHLESNPQRQDKISLIVNPTQILIVGWMYFQLKKLNGSPFKNIKIKEHFISIQAQNIQILSSLNSNYVIKMQIDNLPSSQVIKLTSIGNKIIKRNKIMFRNIKMSSWLKIKLLQRQIKSNNGQKQIAQCMILLDNLQRGKNIDMECLMKNQKGKKIGNITINYEMNNIYLQNSKQIKARQLKIQKYDLVGKSDNKILSKSLASTATKLNTSANKTHRNVQQFINSLQAT